MEHSFPVDEVPDSFWNLEPPMQQAPVDGDCGGVVAASEDAATDRSPSEWSFERLLEEELMNNATPVHDSNGSGPQTEPVPDVAVEVAAVTAGGTATDPVEYNAMLKRKLEEDLASIAVWRASGTPHPEISQGSNADNGGNETPTQNKFSNGRGHLVQKARVPAKLPARSSSMDPSPSDDDDMDGEVEILGSKRPDAEKANKRKQSNRESARRSRSRRAAHMKDLEEQVTHLRVENSLLLRRLDAINQQYNAAAVDNRVLRADMETLRTKVKMAEDTVNRLLGTTPSLPSNVIADTHTPSFHSMPFLGSAQSHGNLPDPSAVPVIQNNYYAAASDAAARVVSNGSYVPARAAPSPLQAEGVIVNGSSSNTRTTNRMAASQSTMSAIELLEKRVMSDTDMPSSSGGGAVPSSGGLDDEVADTSMEEH